MVKQSPHKRWKGCCMMCAGFIRGDGWSHRRPGSDLKQMGGRKRRVKRNDVVEVDYPDNPDDEGIDCQHGCNGDCYRNGSDRCNFTCHPNRYAHVVRG